MIKAINQQTIRLTQCTQLLVAVGRIVVELVHKDRKWQRNKIDRSAIDGFYRAQYGNK